MMIVPGPTDAPITWVISPTWNLIFGLLSLLEPLISILTRNVRIENYILDFLSYSEEEVKKTPVKKINRKKLPHKKIEEEEEVEEEKTKKKTKKIDKETNK